MLIIILIMMVLQRNEKVVIMNVIMRMIKVIELSYKEINVLGRNSLKKLHPRKKN